jgi:fyn-related kinase
MHSHDYSEILYIVIIGGYFITRRCVVSTLDELVEYYSQQADGLCHSLTAICPRVPPSVIGLSYKDEWEIERQSITLKKKIAEGDFGGIWEGLWNQSAPVIVEAYGESSLDAQKLQDKLEILKKIQHKNVLQFYAASTVTESSVQEPIYIIFEFMTNASILLDYLRSDSGHQLKLPQMIDIGAQVASGMVYLEVQNYVHGDLAARSVLINQVETVAHGTTARIKLALHRNEETIKKIRWLAPEAAVHNRFSIKSDVWSFGILLTELVTYGQPPYPGMTNSEVISNLQTGYRAPRPLECPDKLYDTMLDCWREDPGNRPPFETLQWILEEFFTREDAGYRDAV